MRIHEAVQQVVAIYPGRFHPFHKGHASVYNYLRSKFDTVFIATSDKVDPPKSPFSFAEKRAMMLAAGIPDSAIVQTKNPYKAEEILQAYDPATTAVVFAVSAKDMAEDPRFSFANKKDGSPSYFQPMAPNSKQLEGFDKHGYITTVPTLDFTVLGEPMRSATELRRNFAGADNETQKKIVADLYGKYDAKIHKIMKNKITEALIDFERLSEVINRIWTLDVQRPLSEDVKKTVIKNIRLATEAWSEKYKRSINCNNPKGFSQKAHCAGRKKNEENEIQINDLLNDDATAGDLSSVYTPSIPEIAKKHNISLQQVVDQLKKGLAKESEHTKNFDVALEIAMDHVAEIPDYYDRIEDIEGPYVEPDPEGYQKDLLTMPQRTVVIDTPGELDWYKIGQHYPNLGQEDPHEYGQSETDMVIIPPSEEMLDKLTKDLSRLGLKWKVIGGTKDQPEIHSESELAETIRKTGSQYTVYSKKGKRMGTYPSKKKAKERLRQIEYFKHVGESHESCPRTKASTCHCEIVSKIAETEESVTAICVLEHNESVKGTILLKQAGSGPTLVVGKITGLTPGKHGLHIHEFGDLSQGCDSAGGHFNPDNVDHGDLSNGHVGDLGNIVADENGIANIGIAADRITLRGERSVVGRSIVIHSNEDDLGRGGNDESLKTGNAGDRLACGVITFREPINEAVYPGNLGFEEVFKFFADASKRNPKLVDIVQDLIDQGQNKEAWKIIQDFANVKLQGKQFSSESQINERASDIVYHYTTIGPALNILKSGEFQLSSVAGSVEQDINPKGHNFFLSTARSKGGEYHRRVGNSAVMFVLNGRWISDRYPVKPVDYWSGFSIAGRNKEAEDRIFSKDPTMPMDPVTSIHVLLKEKHPFASAKTRQFLILAKTLGIPTYLYKDESAWRLQNTAKAASVEQMKSELSGPETFRSGGSGSRWLKPWLEVIFGKTEADLGKKAKDLVRGFRYYHNDGDDHGLGTELSNARKPGNLDREDAVNILKFMRQNRMATHMDLVNYLVDKWKVKDESINEMGVGRIVKGVNTTPDVGPDEIKKQAAKMGFKVDRDGRPPLLHAKARKNSDPNTLFNLGLKEQELDERGSISVPFASGTSVTIAPHRELKIKKSTPGRHRYGNPKSNRKKSN